MDKRRGRHLESIYIQIYIYLYVCMYTECILAPYMCEWPQRNTSKTYRVDIHVNIIYMYVCIYTEFIYIVAVYLYEQTQRVTYRVIIYICVHVYMYTTFILCTLAIYLWTNKRRQHTRDTPSEYNMYIYVFV